MQKNINRQPLIVQFDSIQFNDLMDILDEVRQALDRLSDKVESGLWGISRNME